VRSCFTQIENFCFERQLDFRVCNTRKETYEALLELRPDLCFVYGWYSILDKQTLELARDGFIGVHPSVLPKYRGGASLVWSMIKGEPEVGLSIFYLSEGLDDGDVIHQIKTKVMHEDTIATILDRLQMQLAHELMILWPKIMLKTAPVVAQDHAAATYCAQRYPEDGEIDWKNAASAVYDFVRAQVPPYPGAFFEFNGEQVIVTRARTFEFPYVGKPGQVARIGNGVYVICGDDRAIILDDLIYKGECLSASSVLRSIKIRLSC
jgi:methionyl-tRNA formyltransferase